MIMKRSKMYRKARPFCDTRLFPVAILWACVLLVYLTAAKGIGFLSQSGGDLRLSLVNLSSFGDGRLVLVLVLATLALKAFTSLIELNVNRSSINRANVDRFNRRMWDEVSSASTHVAAALFASVFLQESVQASSATAPARTLFALGLIAMAFFFYSVAEEQPEAHPETR